MSHTAKIQSTSTQVIDEEVMDKMENNEATGFFDYKPDPEQLTDTEILEDEFLGTYEDLDVTEVLDEQFLFVPDDE
tara:strand:- start:280 stop:507 length:228 start_codon:yes stop_codon:yes gene_type:complete